MREIKFRAWDKSRGKFSNTGNLFMDIPRGTLWWQFGYDINPVQDEDNFILMQFTGLRDKNSKEIYEGDVIARYVKNIHSGKDVEAWRGKVEMQFGEWSASTEGLWRLQKDISIIGNVWENPDLLAARTKG